MKQSLALIALLHIGFLTTFAVTKTTTGNGNWNSPSTWSPSGQPSASDDVIISTGHSPNVNVSNGQCKSLTIQSGASLVIGNSKKLTINSTTGLNVSGTLNVNSGNLTIVNNSTNFTINAGGTFIWKPGDNTSGGATIFSKCIENFAGTSNITINKWYNTSVGLGTVVSSNFGNLTIDGVSGTWQMQNSLETRAVVGTLTITNAYVVLDNTGAISNTSLGAITLTNSSSYLDFVNGTHPGSFTVNSGNVNITGGELDGFYTSGTGNCTFNINGDLTMTSYATFIGSHNHNGNFILNISGNVSLSRSYLNGVQNGSGNATIDIGGNLTTTKSGSTYSEINGIIDGNGNVSINVDGNFSNQGYFDLIWNSGVTGVGNGNGTLTIGGTFSQSDGDFRGIWNATTTTSGSCSITIDTLNFSGGIFMTAYSCASSAINHTLTITGKADIVYSASGNIFRGNGLATLSGTQNNSSFTMNCNGPLTISGNGSAEFSANAGYGTESINLMGAVTISGGTINFGLTQHNLNITSAGQFTVSSGTVYLSKSSGASNITISSDVVVSGGTLNIKHNTGKTNCTFSGAMTISGGTVYLYSNTSLAADDSTNLYVNGDFTQSGGTLMFSNNTANTGPACIFINGENYNLSGTGSISSFGAGSASYFGTMIFNNSSNTNYNRSSTNHHIQQVKYILNNQARVSVTGGPLEISSGTSTGTDFLKISNEAVLSLANNSIVSNGLSTYSGITVMDGGTLKTGHINGLYDGTDNAAICSSANMDFELGASSTICYNGTDNQKISGYGCGTANATKHKYGNLMIDFSGTADNEYCYLERNTTLRSSLVLTQGELKLNGYTLRAETAEATSGYVKSEENNAVNASKLELGYTPSNKNLTFHFGRSSNILIPVSISITNNPGSGYISISTRATGSDNTPLPGNDNVAAITNINPGGADVSTTHVIDRWWEINAAGVTADYTLRYDGSENTTTPSVSHGSFNIQYWNGSNFTKINSSGTGVTSGTGSISASMSNISGPVVISSGSASLPIKLIEFNAALKNGVVELTWATAEEKNNDYFSIERSSDAKIFEKIDEVDGAGNSNAVLHYKTTDTQPLVGTSYYRLKQTDFDGKYSYSPVRVVNQGSKGMNPEQDIELLSLSPNPFTSEFTMSYQLPQGGESRITVFNMSGQIVFDQTKQDDAGINNFVFTSENNLPPANYILQLVNGNKKISKKIIKTSN